MVAFSMKVKWKVFKIHITIEKFFWNRVLRQSKKASWKRMTSQERNNS